MAELKYHYEKLDEEGKITRCPLHDLKSEITGKIILNLPAWFDENPEERIRLGWIKHIEHYEKDIEYNRQTQYLQKSVEQIDEYTVEDVYDVFDKTEEIMLLEEMLDAISYTGGGSIVFMDN